MVSNRAGLAHRDRVSFIVTACTRAELAHSRPNRRLPLQFQSQHAVIDQSFAAKSDRVANAIALRFRMTCRSIGKDKDDLAIGRFHSNTCCIWFLRHSAKRTQQRTEKV